MPHVAARMVLFHYSFIPRCNACSLISLSKKNWEKEAVRPLNLRVNDRNIRGAEGRRLPLPRKEKCHISASVHSHSSIPSLCAHYVTWTRQVCSKIRNKAVSLAVCHKVYLNLLLSSCTAILLASPQTNSLFAFKVFNFFFFTPCNILGEKRGACSSCWRKPRSHLTAMCLVSYAKKSWAGFGCLLNGSVLCHSDTVHFFFFFSFQNIFQRRKSFKSGTLNF